jgi:hypothetical protein
MILVLDGDHFCADGVFVDEAPAEALEIKILQSGQLEFPEQEHDTFWLELPPGAAVVRYSFHDAECNFYMYCDEKQALQDISDVYLNEHNHEKTCELCRDFGTDHCLAMLISKLQQDSQAEVEDCSPDDVTVTWWKTPMKILKF